ncbi:MAG: KEOPS complex subunit Cgi121 [Candidatus Heimdallarchaeota archaeon]
MVNSSHVLIFSGSLLTKTHEPAAIGALLAHVTAHYNIRGAQLFDNRFIWGKRHLYSAVWHAYHAATHNQMISKTLSMEMLLYAAGQRQIQKAIEILGVRSSTRSLAGVILGDNLTPLREAYAYLRDVLDMQEDISLLNQYNLKRDFVLTNLVELEVEHREMTDLDIEKAVLQRVGTLALER